MCDRHHLDREEVRDLVEYLQRWLDTGHLGASLSAPTGEPSEGG